MSARESPDGDAAGAGRLAAVLAELELELDWAVLGDAYCDGGGVGFFGEADREALFDAGLHFASDLAAVLGTGPGEGPRRSLYVGAALAELAPLLCEALVLERPVEAVSLPNAETRELNRALAAVSRRLALDLPRIRTEGLEVRDPHPFDHLWLVSVLNDPEAFPALHDELYGRHGTELATGRGDLAADRERAAALVARALEGLRPPAHLTTTDDELALLSSACAEHGWTLEVPDHARLSAIVGDPVRTCRVTR